MTETIALPIRRKLILTSVLALAFSAENADVGVLSSMYAPVGTSLHASAVDLGTLTMWRGLVQAVMTPIIGSAGNALNRNLLTAAGTAVWGLTSIGLGSAQNFQQAAVWASLNGIGLALVLPCVQSVLADVWEPASRGRAFGTILTIAAVGQIVFNFMAIAEGGREIGSLEGWRFVFYVMAGVAAAVTVLVLLFGLEPRNVRVRHPSDGHPNGRAQFTGDGATVAKASGGTKGQGAMHTILHGVAAMVTDAVKVFRVPSFVLILLAEVVMVVGGAGAGYQIMYFQISGFTDIATATLNACFNVGNAVGMVTGGILGDLFAKRFPESARPFVNQISMLVVAPLQLILYKGLPGSSKLSTGVPGSLDGQTGKYGALLLLMSVVAPWEQANNASMFAEVVPKQLRTSVYAFDKCVTGALGAVAAPLVGLLAERVYHGDGITDHMANNAGAADPAAAYTRNVHNAAALENSLLWVMIAAMAARFSIYGFLYFMLPRDRIAAAAKKAGMSEQGDRIIVDPV